MKRIRNLLMSTLLFGMCALPIFAEDKTYYISNITVKAFQQWSEARVYDISEGPYLFVKLYNTGNVVDTVEFKGMSDGLQITDIGTATEGATKNSRVSFTDGRYDHWLTSIDFRSRNFNGGDYSINGIAIY